jgi:hypothetical protein
LLRTHCNNALGSIADSKECGHLHRLKGATQSRSFGIK